MEEKKELSFEEVNDIRKLIVDAVRNIDDASGKRFKFSNLDCSKELLDRIVFDYRAKFPNGDTYKDIFYLFSLENLEFLKGMQTIINCFHSLFYIQIII